MIHRIVFDCERMKHNNTGLYNYCLHLGRYLQKNFTQRLSDMSIYSPLCAVHKFQHDTSFILQHSLQKFYMPSVKGFDIWHSTFQLSRYIPPRSRKIKVVLTIHDLNFVNEQMSESRKAKLLKRLQKNIDRSDALVCISEYSKKDLLENCNVGNKPVHVIYNGTNTLRMPGLYNHSYRPERPFLFSLGIMCRKKNFHVLLPLLQNHQMELIVAGRVEEPEYLQFFNQSAQRMKVAGSVRYLGDISEPEKSWYYQNCYAFALPSIAEGFGLPVTEAMSQGKPLFLSNRTALPEIGSNAAFYFSDFNASHMQQVFADGMEQYEKDDMQQLIRDRGATFCWDKAAKEYLDVYRSLY